MNVRLTFVFLLTCCWLSDGFESNSIDDVNQADGNKSFIPQMLSYVFDVLDIKGVVKDVKLGKTTAITCTACKFGVGMVKSFVESGKSEQEIAKLAVGVCKTLNLWTNRVCEGVIDLFREQLFYVLERVVLSPDEICGVLLGNTCATVTNPLHDWTIEMPDVPKPPPRPYQPPKKGSPTLKVLHLTDIHLDPYYLQGSETNCKEPVCCRVGDGPGKSPETSAGHYGDYRDCDTSAATLENLLEHVTTRHKIDVVLWTGDVPPHDIWNSTRWENVHIIKTVNNMLRRKFGDVLVFPSVGNHESVPVNAFPPPEEKSGPFAIDWLYDALVDSWGTGTWMNKQAEATIRKGGFYSSKIAPGLKLISVNSNYCNSLNWWLLLNSTDPAQQLDWLAKQLQEAETKGDRVLLIGHIPPGKYDCMKSWSSNFYDIVNRYEDTIVAQFYGHTHQDEFELFYEKDGRATNVAYITPSVTTYGGVNPSFRIFTIDGNYPNSSFSVLDHQTFYMNLTEANLGRPSWECAYSAKDTYSMDGLGAKHWDQLVNKFKVDDVSFQTFYSLFNALSDAFVGVECNEGCKKDILCKLKTGRSNDDSFCDL